MNPSLRDRALNYAEPGFLLAFGVYIFLVTVFETIWIDRDPLRLLNVADLKSRAFTRQWLSLSERENSPLIPKGPVPDLLRTGAIGRVLEIGPGSGIHVKYLDNPSITAIYGAEPTTGLHAQLRKSADAAGVGHKYHILNCGAETSSLLPVLEHEGLLLDKGSGDGGIFDSIISIRVLCGVPDQKDTIQGLYRLLKPGGSFVIYEHVANPWREGKGSIVGRAFQLLYTGLGWTFFWGGCRLGNQTGRVCEEVARKDGGWETADLDVDNPWGAVPYVRGVLIKRR